MDILASLDTQIWFILKLALLFGLLIYIIFAFVIVKQVGLMTDTLELGHERVIKFFASAHLLYAMVVFALALFVL